MVLVSEYSGYSGSVMSTQVGVSGYSGSGHAYLRVPPPPLRGTSGILEYSGIPSDCQLAILRNSSLGPQEFSSTQEQALHGACVPQELRSTSGIPEYLRGPGWSGWLSGLGGRGFGLQGGVWVEVGRWCFGCG